MKNLLTAFQRELYTCMTLHFYGSVIIHSHYVQKLCNFNTSAEHKEYYKKVGKSFVDHWLSLHGKTYKDIFYAPQ